MPTVTVTTNDAEATSVITAATEIPGTTTIVVTALDGTSTRTYTVAFITAVPDEPTVAAADPTEAEADVISIYSDVYTDIAVDNYVAAWSSATHEEITVDGSADVEVFGFGFCRN